MKVNIKNLSGVLHQLEMEPWETIGEVKQRLALRLGCAPAALKIVCRGKTTTDDLSVDSLRLRENEALVVMTLRTKPQPRQQVDAPLPPADLAKPQEIPLQAPSPLDPHLQELIKMGFTKEESQIALSAAFNNPERAVEYLLNGLPLPSSPHPNSPPQHLQAGLKQLKQGFRQNPATLPMLIQELAKTNPPLFEYVTQNPDRFASFLSEYNEDEEEEPEEIQLNDDQMEELGLGELGDMEDLEVEESEEEGAAGQEDAIRRVIIKLYSLWSQDSVEPPQYRPILLATATKKWLLIYYSNVRPMAMNFRKALILRKEMIHTDLGQHLKIIMGCFQGNPSHPRSFQLGKTQLIRLQKLAEGAYGDVWQCRVAGTQTLLALKEIKLQTKQLAAMFDKQSQLLTKLTSQNLTSTIRLKEAIIEPRSDGPVGCLLLEFGTISLFDQISSNKLTDNQIASILLQIATALQEIHNLEICHLDVKPQNLILVEGKYKLCDFGSAVEGEIQVSKLDKRDRNNLVEYLEANSTLSYRSPEMVDIGNEIIGKPSDIWMMGCVAYLMLYRKHPFQGQGKLAILSPSVSFPTTGPLPTIIAQMLSQNPRQRPTASALRKQLKEMST